MVQRSIVIALALIAISGGTAPAQTPECGGDGQRGCCFWEQSSPCDPGLHEQYGCDEHHDCECAPFVNAIHQCNAVSACGAEGQRACCPHERPAPCDPGLVETKQCGGVHRDSVGVLQNPACGCPGPLHSLGTCIDDQKKPAPVDRCWIPPTQLTRDLSLYVAGFNHDTIDGHAVVRAVGVEDLHKVIIGDEALIPEHLVIAFSASSFSSGSPCDAGSFSDTGATSEEIALGQLWLGVNTGLPHHAECLARRLQSSTGRKFRVTQWHNDDAKTPWLWWGAWGVWRGGLALVTGERWAPISTSNVRLPTGDGSQPFADALEVRLQDTMGSQRVVPIYVVHTPGNYGVTVDENNVKLCDAEKNAEKLKANRHVALITLWARMRQLMPPFNTDLPPFLVGDFNSTRVNCLGKATDPSYDWANEADGTADGIEPPPNLCPSLTVTLTMQEDILHIFAGRPLSTQHPSGFGSPSHIFVPTALRFSRNADGTPVHPTKGLVLPHVEHNVVAMDFTMVDPNPKKGRCGCGAGGGGGSALLAVLALISLMRRRRSPTHE